MKAAVLALSLFLLLDGPGPGPVPFSLTCWPLTVCVSIGEASA